MDIIETNLREVTQRMFYIEQENMKYNEETNFGENPNGKEDEIKMLLNEWDELKVLRNKLKYS